MTIFLNVKSFITYFILSFIHLNYHLIPHIKAGNSFLTESLTTFLPSVDSFYEDFDSPTNYVQEEDAFSNLKELMSGLTRDEGTLLLLMMNPNLFTKYNYPKLKTLTETRQMFVDLARNRTDIPEEIASFVAKILIEGPETDSPQNNIRRLSNAFGNIVINCPTIHLADELIARNKTVYKYLFNYRPKSSKFGEWLGVIHYEEVPFVFGYPLRRPKLYTKRDIQFSKRIMKIWSHFAKTGEVLPQLDLVWPKYSENEFYMVLQPNQSSIIQSFNQKYCQFYKTLVQINGR